MIASMGMLAPTVASPRRVRFDRSFLTFLAMRKKVVKQTIKNRVTHQAEPIEWIELLFSRYR